MNKKTLAIVALAAGIGSQSAMAQYPELTPEGKAKIDSLTKVWTAHSDSAWAVAFPIVKKEAMEGRPYVPWAWRPYDLKQAKIPAFPGAEGGGMYTQGGRGGKVLVVTNLNDSGPGSFRWACEQGGARIIVFNVSGIIRLETPIILRAPYVTIAGQTAPGDGICIAGQSFQVNTHDVIVRHMRFRRGATNVWYREDSFGGNPVGNIMIDHCSCEWGLDENISFYRHMFDMGDGKPMRKEPTVNVTIQNTISAKGLDTYNHAFGSTIGGENASFMRNLWADNTGRNPSIGWGGVFNFVNNVVYNWVHRTADGGEFSTMSNFINNYYKPGPLTPKDSPVGYRIVKSESRSQKLFPYQQFGRVYAIGNIMEGNEAVTKDNWYGGIQIADKDLKGEGGVPEDVFQILIRLIGDVREQSESRDIGESLTVKTADVAVIRFLFHDHRRGFRHIFRHKQTGGKIVGAPRRNVTDGDAALLLHNSGNHLVKSSVSSAAYDQVYRGSVLLRLLIGVPRPLCRTDNDFVIMFVKNIDNVQQVCFDLPLTCPGIKNKEHSFSHKSGPLSVIYLFMIQQNRINS